MKKLGNKIKQYFTRKRTYIDGIYLGFALALIMGSIFQAVFFYFNYMDLSKLNEIARAIHKIYAEPYEKEDLTDAMYKGLMNGLDGYSYYMPQNEFNDWTTNTDNTYCGIGIQWQINEGFYYIIKVYENSPAEKAGIKPGDCLWSINGKKLSSMSRMQVDKAFDGEKGTTVDVVLMRDGIKKSYTLTRTNVYVPNVSLEIRDNIGIITIMGFDGETDNEFHDCMIQVKEQNITNLILDLRNNMGGSVEMLGTMMQDIVPYDTLIFSLVEKDGKKTEFKVKSKTDIDYNIYVLVNSFSASCSEILAGSLRDLGLAKLVGVNTYGKGVIQQGYQLSDGSVLYLTCGHYYLPNQEGIPKEGLEPDYEIIDDMDTLEDETLDYAMNLFLKNSR